MDLIFLVAAVAMGGFLYRVRGGLYPTGSTQAARAIWAMPSAIMVGIAFSLPVLWWPMVAVLVFAGELLPHGEFMGMGHDTRHSLSTDTFSLAGIGLARAWLLLMYPLVFTGNALLMIVAVALAALQPACYWLGWQIKPEEGDQPAEWFVGATTWGAIMVGHWLT